MIYVLYHGNCYDGFGAAYSAWTRLKDAAKYIPVNYGQEFPRKEIDDKDLNGIVFILDFSYPKEEMLYWADFFQLVVLDHHKTAEANFKGLSHPNIKYFFDMNKSGARMAWEYFHPDKMKFENKYQIKPNGDVVDTDGLIMPRMSIADLEELADVTTDKKIHAEEIKIPKLILHIEDRDLWQFKLDGSKEIHKALVSYPMDFKLWESFDVEKLKVEGVALERMHNQLVDNIIKGSWMGKIGEDSVPMVNTSIAWSEVGHALLQKYPESKYVASFTEFEKEVMWSLRSREYFDCSEVAKKFGGGGHKQASGFKISKK
jgi:oligoribonuclease NrnB/cAMP/cGMP phosphodiesterase (DHH superfamily)